MIKSQKRLVVIVVGPVLIAMAIVAALIVFDRVQYQSRYDRYVEQQAQPVAQLQVDLSKLPDRPISSGKATGSPPAPSFRVPVTEPEPLRMYLSEVRGGIVATLVAITFSFYGLFYCYFLLTSCPHEGWKRLTFVASTIIALAAGYIVFRETGLPDDPVSIGQLVLTFIAGYASGILIILGGRQLVIWVREGFAQAEN